MIAVLFGSLALGELAAILLFGTLSLLALREFLTLAPMGSRRVLTAGVIGAAVIHYALLMKHWYGFYSVFIPVYVFFFLPAAAALTGCPSGFLTRPAIAPCGLSV